MVTRVVFLGTPHFALPSLQSLVGDARYQVVGVVTQPDRPAGRGQKMTPPPVKVWAEQVGLPVFQPERLGKDPRTRELLEAWKPDVLVVAAFGQLLPPFVFDFPPHGSVNVHPSLLPKCRGAAPIVRTLLNGERETGVTLMKIDQGMDTGPILAKVQIPIGEEQTAGELEEVLARQGAELLLRTLPDYLAGRIQPRPQDDQEATLAPPVRKSEAPLSWEAPALRVHNQIRAFNPWPGASAQLRDQPVKIWRSRLLSGSSSRRKEKAPGTILAVEGEGIEVQCGDSPVLLTELQLPNRRRVPARDLVNGLKLQPGERFS